MEKRARSSPVEQQQILIGIPGYSNLALMHPGSPSIPIDTMYFRGHHWHVKVGASGFNKGVPDFVSVRVFVMPMRHSASGTKISLEILDNTWERTVFRKEEVLASDDSSMFLLVKRTDLEAASCVHNDNIPVRCTLTFLDVKKKRLPAWSKWWHHLKKRLATASSS